VSYSNGTPPLNTAIYEDVARAMDHHLATTMAELAAPRRADGSLAQRIDHPLTGDDLEDFGECLRYLAELRLHSLWADIEGSGDMGARVSLVDSLGEDLCHWHSLDWTGHLSDTWR
jgi:hypothetical protein